MYAPRTEGAGLAGIGIFKIAARAAASAGFLNPEAEGSGAYTSPAPAPEPEPTAAPAVNLAMTYGTGAAVQWLGLAAAVAAVVFFFARR